jgi:hypothetical protein
MADALNKHMITKHPSIRPARVVKKSDNSDDFPTRAVTSELSYRRAIMHTSIMPYNPRPSLNHTVIGSVLRKKNGAWDVGNFYSHPTGKCQGKVWMTAQLFCNHM